MSFLSKEEIDKMVDMLCLDKCFKEAPSLPGISKFCCIRPEDSYVKCKVLSKYIFHSNKTQFEVFLYDSDETDSSSEDYTGKGNKSEEYIDTEDNVYSLAANDGKELEASHTTYFLPTMIAIDKIAACR